VQLIVAPAMNREMWANPATQTQCDAMLQVPTVCEVLDVGQGDQACGETGDGRMLEADEILADLIAFFHAQAAGRAACAGHRRPDL
jgi:phosphopantothenoylcysteine decarboxylase/phosphopantothenate--cysteine ligase